MDLDPDLDYFRLYLLDLAALRALPGFFMPTVYEVDDDIFYFRKYLGEKTP